MERKFYKLRPNDKIWWVENDLIGVHEFSFDKKTVYNLFRDYRKLPKDLKKIFDKENPTLAKLF